METRLGVSSRGGSKKVQNSSMTGMSGNASPLARRASSKQSVSLVASLSNAALTTMKTQSSLGGRSNPAADSRSMRRIIADDPEWSLATVPDLVEITIRHIVENFATNSSILNKLPSKHRSIVLKRISTSLPVKITASLIEDEDYWKRCCLSRWPVCDVSQYGGQWKQMFFERNLQAIIESYIPETTKPTELEDALSLSGNYIHRLTIRQLLPPIRQHRRSDETADDEDQPAFDHFNFNVVLPRLPHLSEFSIMFGVNNCGMNFEWSLFQFTLRDCRLLSECVGSCRTLKCFTLQRSKVDDERLRLLVSRIIDHPSLTELDLSHNVIGDRGARALGKLLTAGQCQLKRLVLADNAIRGPGGQALGHALTRNETLETLNLRLNQLGDDGGQAICRALLKNSTVRRIVLAANELTEPSASVMAQVVAQNTTLSVIDLSCNRLGRDGGKQLEEGMSKNETVTHMDLRLTDCGQESEYSINQVLLKNRELHQVSDLDG